MKGEKIKVIVILIVICLFIVASVIFCIQNKTPITPTKPSSTTGKLMQPELGAYVGTWSQDISPDFSFLRELEQILGTKIRVDHIDLRIQLAIDGSLIGPDDRVYPYKILPGVSIEEVLSPDYPYKVSVMDILQTHVENGVVPALQMHVPDSNSNIWDLSDLGKNIPKDKRMVVQDILDGKYDEYFMKYAKRFKEFGHPILLEFLNEYNAWSWNLSGKNGKTSTFDLAIQVYGSEGAKKIEQYVEQYGWPQNMSDIDQNFRPLEETEFYTSYGDPSVLDSAERVRDTWRHVHDIFGRLCEKHII